MRVLILGAGGTGGYFGGRLLEAGKDVTFLVRPRRAEQLRTNGLVIRSPHGDAGVEAPFITLASEPFDLVILSNKAYDLSAAMDAIEPAVGDTTVIIPVLNGMLHMDALDARFGADKVLGGWCAISATLDADGTVRQLADMQQLRFGERTGEISERAAAVQAMMTGANMEGQATGIILQEMWEKWVRLAALAGATCLMRASAGTIVAEPGGEEFIVGILDECSAIGGACGFGPRPKAYEHSRKTLTEPGSTFTASMLRDVEAGGRVEAEHVLGDLWERGAKRGVAAPLLGLALLHMRAYEKRLNLQTA